MTLMDVLNQAPEILEDPAVREDKGLFPNGITQVRMGLTPRMGENRRGDWVVSAVLPDGHEVEAVFAGRRADATNVLRRDLAKLWQAALKDAQTAGQDLPEAESVRLPVMIEGGWRPRFIRDADGCETRIYQFYAARWTYVTSGGTVEVAGEPARSASDLDLSAAPPPRKACLQMVD